MLSLSCVKKKKHSKWLIGKGYKFKQYAEPLVMMIIYPERKWLDPFSVSWKNPPLCNLNGWLTFLHVCNSKAEINGGKSFRIKQETYIMREREKKCSCWKSAALSCHASEHILWWAESTVTCFPFIYLSSFFFFAAEDNSQKAIRAKHVFDNLHRVNMELNIFFYLYKVILVPLYRECCIQDHSRVQKNSEANYM